MSLQWVFERIAEGLFLGPHHPLRHLGKLHRYDVLLDSNGVPLNGDNIAEATTWRSHHAFSGRCGLRVDRQQQQKQEEAETEGEHDKNEQNVQKFANRNGDTGVPQPDAVLQQSGETIVSESPDDYRTWIADFHLFSTSNEPHVLLSVAPHYIPSRGNTTEEERIWRPPTKEEQEIYDKRMLETPLIWEEPMTLSVDCTANGMYLWSEEWGFFGEKIVETCFVQRDQKYAAVYGSNRSGMQELRQQQEGEQLQEKSYEAFVRLSWRMTPAGEHDSRDVEHRTSSDLTSIHTKDGLQGHGEMVVFVRTGYSQDDGFSDGTRNHSSTGGEGISSSGNGGGGSISSVPPVVSAPMAAASSSSSGCLSGCNGTENREVIGGGGHLWQRMCERVVVHDRLPNGIYFVPYVTLMDGGDEVTILEN